MKERIPDNSIDMILADLPYGTTSCKWDSIIPLEPLWEQYKRVIKENGAIVLTASQPFTTKLIQSNMGWFREEIIWLKNKSGSGFHADSRHIKVHENICVFAKNGSYTYNPQKWEVENEDFLTKRKTLSQYGVSNNIYGNYKSTRKKDDGTRYPISIIAYQVPHNPSYSKRYSKTADIRKHPTQKPIRLFDYIIKTYTNENEIVLDNVIGSGTTAVACLKTNREFIGFEKKEEYYNIALKRIGKFDKGYYNQLPQEEKPKQKQLF